MDWDYKVTKLKEDLMYFIVKRLPPTLKYYIFIDVASHASTGKYAYQAVPELTVTQALQRYGDDKGIHI